jgi:dolichyl-phosphate beta-glucosyltransferase
MNKPDVSIVIPVYNEAARIEQTVREAFDYFAANSRLLLKEIIVVDDGSVDDTYERLMACRDRCGPLVVVQHLQNRGKGAAVKSGVLNASGDTVLVMDADLSTPLRCAEALFDALEQGADIAIGSRALKDSKLTRRQPAHRELTGRLFNLFVQFLFLRGLWDTQCGFKLFYASAAKDIFPNIRIAGFAFDVEFLYLAKKSGYKIAEVPVEWANDPDSRVKMMRDPFLMMKDLVKLYFRASFSLHGTAANSKRECRPSGVRPDDPRAC